MPDGGAPDATMVDDETYALTPFMLGPGEEQVNCYYIPAIGKTRYASKFTVDMNPGSHHLVVFRVDERKLNGNLLPPGPTPCTQIDIPQGIDGMLPGSQQQHFEVAMPDGVGIKIEAYHGMYFQSHYINATQSPITTKVTYRIDHVDPSAVQQVGGVLFYSNYNLNIPPGMSVATQTCLAPQDFKLLLATGHMHKHGLTFDATVGADNIFHTDNWDQPNAAFFPDPGMTVTKDSPIGWSCAYNNTGSSTIHFGNSAVTDEMCILAGVYYPAIDGASLFDCIPPTPPSISCNAAWTCAMGCATNSCAGQCANGISGTHKDKFDALVACGGAACAGGDGGTGDCDGTNLTPACFACVEKNCATQVQDCSNDK
jgi:hypothetical protein